MKQLVRRLKLDSVLIAMFGCEVVDTYRASGDAHLKLGYGRGRPRPLFLGAGPKVILACLPRAQLIRIFETHGAEAADAGLGATWAEFRSYFSNLKREGFYLSIGELEPDVGAAAVPLLGTDGEAMAALTLVGSNDELEAVGTRRLMASLTQAAATICEAVAQSQDERP